MVSNEFMCKAVQIATYKHKDCTKNQYYWKEGSRILPNRLSISDCEISNVTKKGRMCVEKSVGQCLGRFTITEQSPLKQMKPYSMRTQIFKYEVFPQFFGYGTCGINSDTGRITDTGDLLIFYSNDNYKTFIIFFMRGMGKDPDLKFEAFKYAEEVIRDKYIIKVGGEMLPSSPHPWINNKFCHD